MFFLFIFLNFFIYFMSFFFFFFFFNDTATTEIYTLPTRRSSDLRGGGLQQRVVDPALHVPGQQRVQHVRRSEEHTSELQSRGHLVCRLLLEKKKLNSRHVAIVYDIIYLKKKNK